MPGRRISGLLTRCAPRTRRRPGEGVNVQCNATQFQALPLPLFYHATGPAVCGIPHCRGGHLALALPQSLLLALWDCLASGGRKPPDLYAASGAPEACLHARALRHQAVLAHREVPLPPFRVLDGEDGRCGDHWRTVASVAVLDILVHEVV